MREIFFLHKGGHSRADMGTPQSLCPDQSLPVPLWLLEFQPLNESVLQAKRKANGEKQKGTVLKNELSLKKAPDNTSHLVIQNELGIVGFFFFYSG